MFILVVTNSSRTIVILLGFSTLNNVNTALANFNASAHPKDWVGQVFSVPAQDTTLAVNVGRATDAKWQQSYSFNFSH